MSSHYVPWTVTLEASWFRGGFRSQRIRNAEHTQVQPVNPTSDRSRAQCPGMRMASYTGW